jgi:hypothetical protein
MISHKDGGRSPQVSPSGACARSHGAANCSTAGNRSFPFPPVLNSANNANELLALCGVAHIITSAKLSARKIFMLPLLLIPFLALSEGVAEPPFLAPDGQIGIEYKFQIPVSNPDNIKLSFQKVAREIAPGITVDKTGIVHGEPTRPAASTCTIIAKRNRVELSRHDYTLKISPSRMQLLDPELARVKQLPIPAAPQPTTPGPPAPAAPSPPQAADPDPPLPARLRLEPLTIASTRLRACRA